MEDYIFIIIAIVLSIFGAINKKKKQAANQQNNTPQGQEKKVSIFEEMFHDEIWEEPEPEVVTEPVIDKVPQIKKQKKEEKTRRPFLNMKSRIQRIPNQSLELERPELIQEPEVQKKAKLPEMEGFSLKKAVIYSEILNRKY